MSKTKMVPGRRLKPGDMVEGWQYEHCTRFCTARVEKVDSFLVHVLVFPGPNQTEEVVDIGAQFEMQMTDEEYCAKYARGAEKVVEGLKTRLERDEIGPHDWDNHWLGASAFETAEALEEMGAHIAGICSDIVPKEAMFSGWLLDVGVCVEMEDGERFWCHWSMDSVEDTIRDFELRCREKEKGR